MKERLRRALERAAGAGSTPPPAATQWSKVTDADIHAAYRLLLGRRPDPDGLRNFAALVGQADTSELVAGLLCSAEFRGTPMHDAVARRERDDLEALDIGDGLRLLVSPHDASNADLRRSRSYEGHVAAALDACLAPGMSYCAVGANIGYHVVRAARRVGPQGRVVAFEAHPGNAQMVARSLALNGLVNPTVLPLAVSDRRALHRYVAAQGTNGYVEPVTPDAAHDPAELASSTMMQSVRLDDLRALLSPLDVLQMDVEGSEGLVLRGARELLAADRPVVFSELCLGQLERTSRMSGEQALSGLQDLGYRFSAIEFSGEIMPLGDAVEAVCAYARAARTGHVDVRCDPPPRER